MVQKRSIAGAATSKPNCGKSLFTCMAIAPCRHTKLSASFAARYERGKPPRSQRRSATSSCHPPAAPITSCRSKPPTSTVSTRPSSDSPACRAKLGEALPSRRYWPGTSEQQRKELGLALHLVDDDQALQALQHLHR